MKQLKPSQGAMKQYLTDYSLIVVGAFLQALSYVLFIAPYKIVPGGVYGISIVVHHVTKGLLPFLPDGFPMGVTALCFNIPFMILAAKKIGLSSGPKTVVTFLLISIFTDSLSYFVGEPLVENDPFLAAFYGGAILGAGACDCQRFELEGEQYDHCTRFSHRLVGSVSFPGLGCTFVFLVHHFCLW